MLQNKRTTQLYNTLKIKAINKRKTRETQYVAKLWSPP